MHASAHPQPSVSLRTRHLQETGIVGQFMQRSVRRATLPETVHVVLDRTQALPSGGDGPLVLGRSGGQRPSILCQFIGNLVPTTQALSGGEARSVPS